MAPAQQPVYLVDFSVYKPPEEFRVNEAEFLKNAEHWPSYTAENGAFICKVVKRSGLEMNATYLPAAINPNHTSEPHTDMKSAMVEAELVMGTAVESVLRKTGLKPEQVDILITNTSIFCPTPSLASMLINKFKFRKNVQAYHLGGMGCSSGVIGLGLVKDMLQARPNSVALFVPSEITTYCYYPGSQKDLLVANAIFRMGGAAVVLSNRADLGRRSKYALEQCVRVHTGQEDDAYRTISWGPDGKGINGVYLGKDVPVQAGLMLEEVIRTVTPSIMTYTQYAEAAAAWLQAKASGRAFHYVPDYTRCVDHFALHAGGYAVLKGIQKGMNLPTGVMIPSFASLRDFGNTSSSTTWYTLAYLESHRMVDRSHKIMQVGAGGGMKGGVNIWRALKANHEVHGAWAHTNGVPYAEADMPRPISEAPRPASAAPGAVAESCAAAVAMAEAQQGIMHHIRAMTEEEVKEFGVAAL